MFFVIFKMVQPDRCSGFSDIKMNLETTGIYQFKNDTQKYNLNIS